MLIYHSSTRRDVLLRTLSKFYRLYHCNFYEEATVAMNEEEDLYCMDYEEEAMEFDSKLDAEGEDDEQWWTGGVAGGEGT